MEAAVLVFGTLGVVLACAWLFQRFRAPSLVIGILPEARQELLDLLLSQSPRRPTAQADALDTAVAYLEDLDATFREHDGHLPGAREERAPDHGRWWWRYANGIWVLYRVSDTRRWFRRPVRTVTIVGFDVALPVL